MSPNPSCSPRARRWAIGGLFACLALILFGVSSFQKLQTQYSIMQFLPAQHPAIADDREVRARFGLVDHPTFVGLIEMNGSADWLNASALAPLEALSNEMKTLPGVARVISLANIEGVATSHDDLNVGPVLKLTPEKDWRQRVLQDPLLSPALIGADARSLLVYVALENADVKPMADVEMAFKERLTKYFPSAKTSVGGVPAVQTDLGLLLNQELRNFLALTLVACAITLSLVFRNWSAILTPLLLTAFANVMVVATMAWTGLAFTILSSTIPILVFITVVSLAVHIQLRVHEDAKAREFTSKWDLIRSSCLAIWLPNLLGALTSCVGFLTLLSGDVPLIRNYGIGVAMAVMVSWALVSVGILPLLLLFPLPEPRSWVGRPARWALLAIRRRRAVIATVVALCAILSYRGRTLDWTGRLFDDLPRGQAARESTERIDRSMGGIIPLELSISLPSGSDWKEPQAVEKLAHLVRDLRATEGIGLAFALTDFLASAQLEARQPITRSALAETYLLFSFSPNNPLAGFLSDDQTSALISLKLHDLPAQTSLALVQNIERQARAAFPGATVQAGAMGAYTHLINNELSTDLIFGFWQALVIIVASLALIFRSLRWALLACLPNLVPPVALLGYLALTHTPIKPGVAIIFSIALGLAFNNTVYVLNRLKNLSRDRRTFPIAKTFYLEGNPCLVSTLIIMTGFSVFMFSYFPLNQTFGACMLVSIVGGIIGDLLFLPALLYARPTLLGRLASRAAEIPKVLTPPDEAEEDHQHQKAA